RFRYTNSKGWQIGMDMDAGVRAVCSSSWRMERTIVQRNRIHHPRYGANSWSWDHPAGPQAITYSHCGGNHVIRYNEIYSEDGHYFNAASAAKTTSPTSASRMPTATSTATRSRTSGTMA